MHKFNNNFSTCVAHGTKHRQPRVDSFKLTFKNNPWKFPKYYLPTSPSHLTAAPKDFPGNTVPSSSTKQQIVRFSCDVKHIFLFNVTKNVNSTLNTVCFDLKSSLNFKSIQTCYDLFAESGFSFKWNLMNKQKSDLK